jgi:hypothetical protein
MGVVHVGFEWQGIGGCFGKRVFWSLPDQKIAKIRENVMMSLMQWWSRGDSELKHRRGRYGCGRCPIRLAGHVRLLWHEGVLVSARAKNSENERECQDVIDAMVEWSG